MAEAAPEAPAATSSPRAPKTKGKGKGKGRSTAPASSPAVESRASPTPVEYTVEGACEYLSHLSLEERQTVRRRMDPDSGRQSPAQEAIFLRRPDGGIHLRLADGTTVETGGPLREVDLRQREGEEPEPGENGAGEASRCSAQ